MPEDTKKPVATQSEKEIAPEESQIQEWRHIVADTFQRADEQQVIFKPRGFEWEISSFFREDYYLPEMNQVAQEIKEKYIIGKRVLVVPAYSTNPYILKAVGAREVVGIDADEATVEWQRAIQQYFDQDEIGQDFLALAHYPDEEAVFRLGEKFEKYREYPRGINFEKGLREKIRTAITQKEPAAPLEGVQFIQATLGASEELKVPDVMSMIPASERNFDFLFIPYLLGVKNGVESEQGVRKMLDELWELGHDGSAVMIAPFSDSEKELKEMFGAEHGRTISEMKNLIPADKFSIEQSFFLMGSECAILKIIKR